MVEDFVKIYNKISLISDNFKTKKPINIVGV